ncbi:C-C motif chemokine 13-like [Labeo rohita]|uniref:C-C motif chemokine 13-like n=1 Tax=Labeo rohita TaxID=84645 RepID=UPI0021E219A4|nr:C-C motif chemokine 13-like [Labeo rohita]
MRGLMCVLFLVIFCYEQIASQHSPHEVSERCCFNFIDFPLPVHKIISAVKTGSHCPVAGILVTTHRTEFCVKPDEAWIKRVIEGDYWK